MGNPYLACYNWALFAGWGWCLYLTISAVASGGDNARVWQDTHLVLMVAQTAAVLEVVHSAIGLVRSPVLITAMQVASRLFLLWGILVPVPEARTTSLVLWAQPGGASLSLGLTSLLVAWASSEVIRYSFFGFKELGYVPYPSLYLRYSGFIVLYPLGIASELALVFLALPYIKERQPFSVYMPNRFNITFDYYVACWLAAAAYVPGIPTLYGYMLVQRSKMLSPVPKVKAA